MKIRQELLAKMIDKSIGNLRIFSSWEEASHLRGPLRKLAVIQKFFREIGRKSPFRVRQGLVGTVVCPQLGLF